MKKETNKDIIEETLENKIITTIMPEIKERVLKEVDDLTKTVRKSIKTINVVKADGTKKEETSIVHEKFEEILTLVNNNIPVMLTGGAGSGKSSTCEKVAQALRFRFLFQQRHNTRIQVNRFYRRNRKLPRNTVLQSF